MTIVVSVEISIQFCRFFKGIYCENVKSRCIQKLESKNRLCDLFLRIFGCPKDLKNSLNLTFDQKGIGNFMSCLERFERDRLSKITFFA